MSSGFPPLPVFPYGIDSDRTLYKVYNTTESPLTENNEPWAEEIPVMPRKPGQLEIWADNGFGNISGELFYYDAVEKDDNGFVKTLKRCLRNLGGTHTQFNVAGTMVRGFVIAEHHNQIAEAIFRIENFVGENFTDDTATLDWRIRNLQSTPVIFDDFDCPDVDFTFIVLENDPAAGILVRYNIAVVGTYTNFSLDFGDGNVTQSVASGTHRYAPNANVDPIITISNEKCQIVQSPIDRTNTDTPEPPGDDEVIILPIPDCPDLGDIIFPSISVPDPDIVIPPVVFPCLDISPFPSTILGPISIILGDIGIPSNITITPIGGGFPSNISIIPPSIPPIEFGPFPEVPPVEFGPIDWGTPPTIGPIDFGPPPEIPPVLVDISPIVVDVNVNISPVVVNIDPVDVNVEIDVSVDFGNVPEIPIDWGGAPSIPVDWGSPPEIPVSFPNDIPCIPVCWGPTPTIPVNITVTCNCACCPSTARLHETEPEFMDSFNPFLPSAKSLLDAEPMEINYDFQGFPSVIEITPPEIPAIQVVHDIPDKIELMMPSQTIIQYVGPPIPDVVTLKAPDKPIEVTFEMPKTISVEGIPTSIQLEAPASPLQVDVNVLGIPSAIQVVGIPSVIELVHNLPDAIELTMPENPVVQMVAPAVPISVVVTLDVQKELVSDAVKGNLRCFALVPCGN